MPLKPGTHLGPYELLALIGAGGMGEVYKARDTRLDRTVAIKVLPAHLSDRSEIRERFEREARAIAALNHPHICTLYDIGRAEIEESQIADRRSQVDDIPSRARVPSPERERRVQPSEIDTTAPVAERGSQIADSLSGDGIPGW